MIVNFKIEYFIASDEQVVWVRGNERVVMSNFDGRWNVADIEVEDSIAQGHASLEYRYEIERGGEVCRTEWSGIPHTLNLGAVAVGIAVKTIDVWRDMPHDRSFYSSLFTESIFRRGGCDKHTSALSAVGGSVTISATSPMVEPHQKLVMVGSCAELGEWNHMRGVQMADGEFPVWRSPALAITEELLNSEFKFVIVDTRCGSAVAWESGENRNFGVCHYSGGDAVYMEQRAPIFDAQVWRGAGVAIPLFSIRSEDSCGVGDFMDLKKMVDWAAMTGQKIIQILPINDSTMTHTWEDSYPYNANSIFALHPQYISLRRAGALTDKVLEAELLEEGRRLNSLDALDYVAVNNLKDRYMRQLYEEVGAEVLKSAEFVEFFKGNSYWLESYALFSLLRDKYETVDFAKWGDESKFTPELVKRYSNKRTKLYKSLAYYYFVQFNLHVQLVEAREYATQKGVAFKGDIPIGVSRTSVDVWVNPNLFHLNAQAGAPPDDFSVLGQNWGFPTYNWAEMAKDGYAWWYARFGKMAEYFDAYRIDHILGFFRIWEIPLDAVHGLLGYFSPAMPLSVEEIKSRFGFPFDESMARPAINNWLLDEIFAGQAEAVKIKYLEYHGGGSYQFKKRYDTQIKIARAVKDEAMSLKLMTLHDEVLFVEDPYRKGCYHPRISADHTYVHRALSASDKDSYNHMYGDFYYHRHNDFWQAEAMKKLPVLISATNMLTCGEDLGMIPHCVPAVMEGEQILSLEIQRMAKDPALEFGEPWNYPYRSVCTTSTHDMNPLRAWLLEDAEVSKRYLLDVLGIDADVEYDCSGEVCEAIIRQHLDSPAMWTILPLQDWLSISEEVRHPDPHAERINIPASSRHYWRYRMHCTVEELISYTEVNMRIKALVESCRG